MSDSNLATIIPEYQFTKKRLITRRGVMWLGQTCNIRCHFCYFLDRIKTKNHPEHPFMSIDKAKKICKTLVDVYGNNAIDIQGGEPTIYKDIYELVSYCREIGLIPTLITNGVMLERKEICEKLKEAGLRDFLLSIQGIGDNYDEIVGVKGAYKKQKEGLKNIIETGIPLRFNCVLSKSVLPQLEEIAQLAVDSGVRAVNFLAFNPFEDQQIAGKRDETNVPLYSEVSPHLNKAMDILAENNIECNVRYFPICMVEPRHRKSMYNFQQLPYDAHEWDYASWSWTGQQPQRMKFGDCSPVVDLANETYKPVQYKGPMKKVADLAQIAIQKYPKLKNPALKVHKKISSIIVGKNKKIESLTDKENLYRDNGILRSSQHCRYQYASACNQCSVKNICDGFHGDYASLYTADEAKPIKLDEKVTNPKYFIKEQDKVIEEEDYQWAL